MGGELRKLSVGWKLLRVRGSWVRVAESCLRKFYLDVVRDLAAPPSDAMQNGTLLHAHVEAWLRDGVTPPDDKLGRVARRGLYHLPPPLTAEEKATGTGLLIEKRFEMPTWDGGPAFFGTPDLISLRSAPHLYDHKTTGIMKNAKTPIELSTDVQLNTYAKHIVDAFGVSEVPCSWVYYETGGGDRTKKVDLVVKAANIQSRWVETLETVAKMCSAAECEDWHAIAPPSADKGPGNEKACHMWGGCPHRKLCLGLTEIEGRKVKLFDKLSAGKPIVNAATKAEAPVTVTTKSAPYRAVAPKQAAPPPIEDESLAEDTSFDPDTFGDDPNDLGVIPPDAPAPVVSLPPEEPKAAKGRTKKAPKTAPTEMSALPQEEAAAPETPPAAAPQPAATQTGCSKLTVLIGCVKTKGGGEMIELDDLIASSIDAVRAQQGVDHVGLIDYAKGGAFLSATFERELDKWMDEASTNRIIFADKLSPSLRAVSDVLVRRAAYVVRGI
jgi:PD-(D/E)XK nuclease superfamily